MLQAIRVARLGQVEHGLGVELAGVAAHLPGEGAVRLFFHQCAAHADDAPWRWRTFPSSRDGRSCRVRRRRPRPCGRSRRPRRARRCGCGRSTTMPPPTPVPRVTSMLLRTPREAPKALSASAATLASLSTIHGQAQRRRAGAAISGTSTQPRLLQKATSPRRGDSAAPGMPTPTAANSAIACPLSRTTRRQSSTISAAMSSKARSMPVGQLALHSILPPSSTTPALAVVPPTSMPMYNHGHSSLSSCCARMARSIWRCANSCAAL